MAMSATVFRNPGHGFEKTGKLRTDWYLREVQRADENIRIDVHPFRKTFENVGLGAELHCSIRLIQVTVLMRDRAIGDEICVVAAARLEALLGLLEGLHLPVGIAPLILSNLAIQMRQLTFMARSNRHEEFSISFLKRSEQRASKFARLSRELPGLLYEKGKPIWIAGAADACRFAAQACLTAPTTPHRIVPPVLTVVFTRLTDEAPRTQAFVNQR